jgi:hypothetical protein
MHLPQSVSICAGIARSLSILGVPCGNTRATHALHPFARASPAHCRSGASLAGHPCNTCVAPIYAGATHGVAPIQKVAREVDVLMLWTASMSIHMNRRGTGLSAQHRLLLQHRNATVHNNESEASAGADAWTNVQPRCPAYLAFSVTQVRVRPGFCALRLITARIGASRRNSTESGLPRI